MKKRSFTLYVKSIRKVVGTEKWGRWGFAAGPGIRAGGYRLSRDYKEYSEAKYESTLPYDQKKIVELVKAISQKYNSEVKIIDVSRENILQRIVSEKVRKIRSFPTLVNDVGERIEGKMPEEKIELFINR